MPVLTRVRKPPRTKNCLYGHTKARLLTVRLFLTLFAGCFLHQAVSATPVDLAGTWDVHLTSCLPAETQCHMQRTETVHRLNFPANLHETFPWFYGEAQLTREFSHNPITADAPP